MPDQTPRPSPDVLDAAVDRIADRVRPLPESALRRGVAARGLTLARELSRRAQLLERPDAPPRELPDDGMYVVGDQIAVAGHDLAYALRAAPPGPGTDRELAAALELLRTF
ncbi:hypothetical protein [Streptomyces avicenniae]|uniref:hypothetical protein n=1 Tax=Streptomyces avicenniae TaxID=500153 RepID=UPI00069B2627|nr:hypothetical protein [Streptomyces avicenniae]